MTSIGVGIGDTGPVFTQYRIDTNICSIAHPCWRLALNRSFESELSTREQLQSDHYNS